ncbi:hypothetical protein J5N97_022115 [Dioscorea zingiberensis]|uniref:Uncharacterized protein n=1 Tax=Dioscorea zingiberensis TaxID=325984 RepID=A0A9D5C9S7_9LILI|nr:hypothetical protein J5N97_022115 [Dioscorea zingiberensis]
MSTVLELYSWSSLLDGRRLIAPKPMVNKTLSHGRGPCSMIGGNSRSWLIQSFKGDFRSCGLYQALAIASMCIQEQAASRPLIADVVTALSYLASQGYDPSDKGRSRGGGHDEAKAGRILAKADESSGSGRRLELDSEKEDSPREIMSILNKGFDRERAVAEAKLWGENWREKRRQSNTNSANADG